jgi:hypothetical protein
MILKCTCQHNYQDRKYGPGMRVHNKMTKIKDSYRCSVCETVRSVRRLEKDEKVS